MEVRLRVARELTRCPGCGHAATLGAVAITWMSAFLDFRSRADFDVGTEFWSAVTGYERSPLRGPSKEFATLLPATGDDYLRVQCLADGPGRIHLDLHVVDPRAAATRAQRFGATLVVDSPEGYVVMRSPGDFTFCFVDRPRAARSEPANWPDSGRSAVDQVCIDVPSVFWKRELQFWSELTGWKVRPSQVHPDFARLAVPDELPLRLLLQKLGNDDGVTRAHLDLAATDRNAEVARHRDLGARVVSEHSLWTVLADPTDARYCVTDRDPDTGLLPV